MPLHLTPAIAHAFLPTGVLRAAINLGNPLLARRLDQSASGVSVDLAAELARVLGAGLELVVVDTAAQAVAAVETGQADIGFFAIDPVRGAHIAFTAPYLLIEGFYLVPQQSAIRSNAEVDRAGQRVVVGKGSAYDLYLTRHLQHAQIERAASSQAVVETFLATGAEVAAGVRQQLEADAARRGGLRLLEARFMVIEQAMGLAKSRGGAASSFLAAFVEQVKASGVLAQALQRHAISGVTVAPPAAAGAQDPGAGASS